MFAFLVLFSVLELSLVPVVCDLVVDLALLAYCLILLAFLLLLASLFNWSFFFLFIISLPQPLFVWLYFGQFHCL